MWKTLGRTTACLAVSAAAIIAAARMDASAAAKKSSGADTPESKPAPAPNTRKSAPPKPAPAPEPKLTMAGLATKASFAEPPAAAAAATNKDDAAMVAAPNWKGKRLSVARREARKLGIEVAAVDESGEAVPAEMASGYRVRRQLAQIGNAVRLVVREIAETAEGY